MIKIEITDIIYNGYERLFKLKMDNNSNITMWAHGIEHNEYIESGLIQYDPPKKANATFKIEWVMEITKVDEEIKPMIVQDIVNSSHARCVGTVEKLIEIDSFTCNIGNLGVVTVELEGQNDVVEEKMRIKFAGNLEVELI